MTSGPSAPADLSALSALAPELAAAFVSLASDIALVIDDDGVIRSVAVGDHGPSAAGWVGRPWADTVTGSTRRKIESLLGEVGSSGIARRREVNHPSPGAPDIPMAYTAIRLGSGGPVLAVGRDLRAVAAIQQRFVEAQQEVEREYWKLRQTQTRQRLLHQAAHDAVLVADGDSLAVVQYNPSAARLLGLPAAPLPNAVAELLAMARSTGQPAEVRLRLADSASRDGATIELSATPFRAAGEAGGLRVLLRARAVDVERDDSGAAIVIADSAGRVLMANAAFESFCRGDAVVAGRTLVDLLGDPQRSLAALLADTRRDGLAERRMLVIGSVAEGLASLQASASLITEGDQEHIGLTLQPLGSDERSLDSVVRSLERLLGRVGQQPLDDLMREAADIAERHAIDTARRASTDDTAAAAMLGLTDDEFRRRLERLGLDTTTT